MNDQEWSETVLREGLGRIATWSMPSVPDIENVGASASVEPIAGRRPPPVWLAAAAVAVLGVAGVVWAAAARDDGGSDPVVPATQPPEPAPVTAVDLESDPAALVVETLVEGIDSDWSVLRRVDVVGVVEHYGIDPAELRALPEERSVGGALAWEAITQGVVPFQFGDHRAAVDPASLVATLSTARQFGSSDTAAGLVIAATTQDRSEIIDGYLAAGWERIDESTLRALEFLPDPDLPSEMTVFDDPAFSFPIVQVGDGTIVLATSAEALDRYTATDGPSEAMSTLIAATTDDVVVEIRTGDDSGSDQWQHPLTRIECVDGVASSWRNGEFAVTVVDGGQGVLTGVSAPLSDFQLGMGAPKPPVTRYSLTSSLDHRLEAVFALVLSPDSDLVFDTRC